MIKCDIRRDCLVSIAPSIPASDLSRLFSVFLMSFICKDDLLLKFVLPQKLKPLIWASMHTHSAKTPAAECMATETQVQLISSLSQFPPTWWNDATPEQTVTLRWAIFSRNTTVTAIELERKRVKSISISTKNKKRSWEREQKKKKWNEWLGSG